jgi:hypothetical protein
VLRATALASGYLLALALVWVAREIVLTSFLGMLFGLAVGSATERLATFSRVASEALSWMSGRRTSTPCRRASAVSEAGE